MSRDSCTTVRVVFEPPTRANSRNATDLHQRHLQDIPQSLAQQMIEDYEKHERNPTEVKSHHLYTIPTPSMNDSSEEAMVALDFDEICAMTTIASGAPSAVARW